MKKIFLPLLSLTLLVSCGRNEVGADSPCQAGVNAHVCDKNIKEDSSWSSQHPGFDENENSTVTNSYEFYTQNNQRYLNQFLVKTDRSGKHGSYIKAKIIAMDSISLTYTVFDSPCSNLINTSATIYFDRYSSVLQIANSQIIHNGPTKTLLIVANLPLYVIGKMASEAYHMPDEVSFKSNNFTMRPSTNIKPEDVNEWTCFMVDPKEEARTQQQIEDEVHK